MPIDFNTVYKLTSIHKGVDGPPSIVAGAYVQKVLDEDLGHEVSRYVFMSNTAGIDIHSFIGGDETQEGDTIDVHAANDPYLVHRFEPLTLDLWNGMKSAVIAHAEVGKGFESDEDVQNFFIEDLVADGWKPQATPPKLEVSAADKAIAEAQGSTPPKGGHSVPPGTIHTWSDGYDHQKQHDGTWLKLVDSPHQPEQSQALLKQHPQLQAAPSTARTADETPEKDSKEPPTPEKATPSHDSEDSSAKTPDGDGEPETAEVWTDKAKDLPEDTQKAYSKESGGKRVYDDSRKSLHEVIQDGILSGSKPVKAGAMPVAVLTMGLPASGKSTKAAKLWGDKNFAFIDPDDIKEALPEYKMALAQRARNAAEAVHNESGDVATETLERAQKERYNFVFDGVGRDLDWYSQLITKLRQQGFFVIALMQHVENLPGLLHRAEKRGSTEGRFIHVESTKAAYQKLPKNFRAIDRLVHTTLMFDGDKLADEPFYERHENQDPVIRDREKHARFQAMSESLLSRMFVNEGLQSTPHLPPAVSVADVASVFKQMLQAAKSEHPDGPGKFKDGQGIVWPLSDR